MFFAFDVCMRKHAILEVNEHEPIEADRFTPNSLNVESIKRLTQTKIHSSTTPIWHFAYGRHGWEFAGSPAPINNYPIGSQNRIRQCGGIKEAKHKPFLLVILYTIAQYRAVVCEKSANLRLFSHITFSPIRKRTAITGSFVWNLRHYAHVGACHSVRVLPFAAAAELHSIIPTPKGRFQRQNRINGDYCPCILRR